MALQPRPPPHRRTPHPKARRRTCSPRYAHPLRRSKTSRMCSRRSSSPSTPPPHPHPNSIPSASAPTPLRRRNGTDTRVRSSAAADVLHAMSAIQCAVLGDIFPTWLTPLRDAGHELLATQFFCPSPSPSPSAHAAANTEDTAAGTAGTHGMEVRCSMAASALPALLAHLPDVE